jgi:cytochrome c553
MKRIVLSLSALILTTAVADDLTPVKQEGIKYIKMLGSALKGELKQHLQADKSGLEAVNFCATKAQAITAEVNAKLPKYARVRRTAPKVRNLANTPDETDKKVMEAYETKIKEEKFDPKDIEVLKTGDTYRVYKPLITQKVCLKCHGTNIEPKIAATIKKYYPKDQATGFKEGDLRGVIVAEIRK